MATITAKPFDQMTLSELRHEHAGWERFVDRMEIGDLSRAVAIEFRDRCAAWIEVRERETADERAA